jgi:hypothetical protein
MKELRFDAGTGVGVLRSPSIRDAERFCSLPATSPMGKAGASTSG